MAEFLSGKLADTTCVTLSLKIVETKLLFKK